MKIETTPGYFAEDVIPWATVRAHLRYAFGDEETLVKHYAENAIAYVATLTGYCLSSPASPVQEEDPATGAFVDRAAPRYGERRILFEEEDLQGSVRIPRMRGSWAYDLVKTTTEADDVQSFTSYEVGVDGATSDSLRQVLHDAGITIYEGKNEWVFDFTNYDQNYVNHDGTGVALEIVLQGGQDARELPPQFRQAVLLLVGHYDMNREAEYTGGISTELKEGVRRIVSSLMLY